MAASLLLFALLLVATLAGPSAYLIAWNASVAVEYDGSTGERTSLIVEQIGQKSDGNGETEPSPTSKRPKGPLKLGNETQEAFALATPSENPVVIGDSDTAPKHTIVETELGSTLLPPQLLQRPPPAPPAN